MGIYSTDEVVEMAPDQYSVVDTEVKEKANQQPLDFQMDKETGEVKEPQKAALEAPAETVEPQKKRPAERVSAKPSEPAEQDGQQTFDPGF